MSQPLTGDLATLLHQWMPQQRWYPAKGRGVSLAEAGRRELGQDSDGARVELVIVAIDSGDRRDVVQVPLTLRPTPLQGGEAALLGQVQDEGSWWVYDGPHDPSFIDILLDHVQTAPGRAFGAGSRISRVLGGEQSNTSIVVESDDTPVIIKVFRTLQPGANPDVEVLGALADRGCRHVPELLGWLQGSWLDADGSEAEGHLAVVTGFLAGSQDAWREALAALSAGESFDDEARGLGAATARVHLDLGEAFGWTQLRERERAALVQNLIDRVMWARQSTDALSRFGSALDKHVAQIERLDELPDLQRIHGDLHLGQVLHAPDRGWVLLDFEGEPLRPLAERTLPDLPARDVAGMMRSFDYAAGHASIVGDAEHRVDQDAAQRWASSARSAFCDGYADIAGVDPRDHAEPLAALEIDKALYEVVYESRNRPAWIDVPLQAVDRLLGL